jgi:hypothetical protein
MSVVFFSQKTFILNDVLASGGNFFLLSLSLQKKKGTLKEVREEFGANDSKIQASTDFINS